MPTNADKDEAPTPALKLSPPSLLSADLHVTGTLHSEGEIHIDSNVTGDIRTDVLIIGNSASINGEIIADSVTVHGRVTGQIRARSVTLYKTAHVQGDILHEKLIFEQGAYLDGHCRRIDNDNTDRDNAIIFLMKGLVKSNRPPKKTNMDTTAKA
jgi:cytoskeletal protein CcmA (bactofilin family)